jgi:hypothetical protein
MRFDLEENELALHHESNDSTLLSYAWANDYSESSLVLLSPPPAKPPHTKQRRLQASSNTEKYATMSLLYGLLEKSQIRQSGTTN